MAATVEEGTAPKLVLVNAGKLFPIASVNRDSRKDGTLSPSVCVSPNKILAGGKNFYDKTF